MKILDKIVEYFFERKIKTWNIADINEISEQYWNASVYTKLPLMKKYCVWSTYTKTVEEACDAVDKACENKYIVKEDNEAKKVTLIIGGAIILLIVIIMIITSTATAATL